MECEEIQGFLVHYLEGEITPSEQHLICQHLNRCILCQNELAALTATRYAATQALHGLARHAVPSQGAWQHLQARLAKAAQPSPSKLSVWFSRLAPGDGHAAIPIFGEKIMRTKSIVLALAAVVVLSILALYMARSATPVSAQEILTRAHKAQSASSLAQGIQHIRIESYYASPEEGQDGVKTIMDNYSDFQTGNNRLVIANSDTGQVLEATAYDGSYTYSSYAPADSGSEPLTVYRSPQSRERVTKDYEHAGDPAAIAKQLFMEALANPDVKASDKEPWSDGRAVYILSFPAPVKAIIAGGVEPQAGLARLTFDAVTYKLLESRQTLQKDGEETLVNFQRYLVNEILPADSRVAWDLSDLAGVVIVDDPAGENGDLLPEIITVEELAANTQGRAYLLDSTPDGFDLEITAPPKQDNEQDYVYIASYRNAKDDYLVLQANPGELPPDFVQRNFNAGAYTTASGAVINFGDVEAVDRPSGKQFVSAFVTAPDGSAYLLNSTLPLDQVKALAEHLRPVKD